MFAHRRMSDTDSFLDVAEVNVDLVGLEPGPGPEVVGRKVTRRATVFDKPTGYRHGAALNESIEGEASA